ncbi:hypothetical protein QFC22_004250 [Naganishia vaughanmartiniae]|uniref:Uncharacterized protein n=1 Tax=Naganishia vaughanmartiniae TaxID=1424756 RepID=A0ACC2X4I9_9TREE|nr:hypothetical protein QFC22_004250 [Naganishia vaughanmartiniae]
MNDTRSQHGTPGPSKTDDDQYYMPLTDLSTRSQPQPRSGNNGTAIPPTSDQIALGCGGFIVPRMPKGEEYDAETEAERQAAWEEYYRLQAAAAGLGMYDGGQDVGYSTVEEWIDTQTQT